MAIRISLSTILRSALAALCFSGAWASAQGSVSAQASNDDKPRVELAASYEYMRSNAPPDGCACFSLNGGGASVSVPLGRSFA